jgi:hypothetical protein
LIIFVFMYRADPILKNLAWACKGLDSIEILFYKQELV